MWSGSDIIKRCKVLVKWYSIRLCGLPLCQNSLLDSTAQSTGAMIILGVIKFTVLWIDTVECNISDTLGDVANQLNCKIQINPECYSVTVKNIICLYCLSHVWFTLLSTLWMDGYALWEGQCLSARWHNTIDELSLLPNAHLKIAFNIVIIFYNHLCKEGWLSSAFFEGKGTLCVDIKEYCKLKIIWCFFNTFCLCTVYTWLRKQISDVSGRFDVMGFRTLTVSLEECFPRHDWWSKFSYLNSIFNSFWTTYVNDITAALRSLSLRPLSISFHFMLYF